MPPTPSKQPARAIALADDRLPLDVCWRIWIGASLALWLLIGSLAS